jgi:hypothetical protein
LDAEVFNATYFMLSLVTQDELLGKRAADLIARGEKKEEPVRTTKQVLRGGRVGLETVRYRKDGSPVHVELMAGPVWSGGQGASLQRHSIDGKAQEILDRGCSGFIRKPLNLPTLSRKLRGILGR